MRIIRFFAIGMVAVVLAGCSTPFGQRLQAAISIISSAEAATVDPKAIVIAANIALGLQSTGKNYLRLRRCPVNFPICRDPEATVPLIRANAAMRDARNAAQTFVKTHPGQLGPSGLYDGLNAAIGTVQKIFVHYNVAGTVAMSKPQATNLIAEPAESPHDNGMAFLPLLNQ